MRTLPATLAVVALLAGLIGCTSYPPLPVDDQKGTSGSDTSGRKIEAVTITPEEATLSVPPQNPNLASAGFATSLQLDARVVLEGGDLLDGDLVWTSSNPELVQVDARGYVSTVRTTGGAKPSLEPVILKATSRRAPEKSATVTITVVDEGTTVVQLQ
ncbi:hypothetical protein J7643_17655 [bacterium]|nr:hypothetical protein [bacterium]